MITTSQATLDRLRQRSTEIDGLLSTFPGVRIQIEDVLSHGRRHYRHTWRWEDFRDQQRAIAEIIRLAR